MRKEGQIVNTKSEFKKKTIIYKSIAKNKNSNKYNPKQLVPLKVAGKKKTNNRKYTF